MSKALVFVLPSHGHIHPTLPVVQELIARGEEIVYYTTENFASQVQATGATVRLYDSNMPALLESVAARITNQTGIRPTVMPFFMLDEASHVLPQLLESVRAENADYIMYDAMCLWGKLLTKLLHLPAIIFQSTYATNENLSIHQLMTLHLSPPNPEMMESFQAKLADLETTYGISLPKNPYLLMAGTEPLNLTFLPRVFQPHAELFDERFLFVGPSIATRNDAQKLHLVPTEKPLLFISLGTVFNNRAAFFRQCFQAFSQQPLQVILACGSNVDLDSLGEIPANFQVRPYVPQLDVLRQTTVFITHGGMNSTMEALYYGVPLVVIPQMVEQAMTAQRVSELQLGLMLKPEQVTVEALQAAVQEILHNPSYKAHVTQMQAEIKQAGGYKRAVDAILALTHNKN
ncbi:MAG TPA: macrolide family glycosyltransferase [Ktedonobacteraceae bacterium]